MRAVELGLASSERGKRFSVTFWQRQRSAYVATENDDTISANQKAMNDYSIVTH